jgi:Periplasmic copper-binding protein (NosD)
LDSKKSRELLSIVVVIIVTTITAIFISHQHIIIVSEGTQSSSISDLITNMSNIQGVNNSPIEDVSGYLIPRDGDLIIHNGSWTMKSLHEKYPTVVELMTPARVDDGYLAKETIVVDKGAELNITNDKVFLESFSEKYNIPSRIIIMGKGTIFNSTITSWDPLLKAPDPNPYLPRSFILAKDGGKMNILNSTISNLGFSLGGINDRFSSIAGINYYNTSNFLVADSTIAYNFYGFYSDHATNFKITGNKIYGQTHYGLDPHTGSKDFIVDSNHISVNGEQGIICSFQCKNVTITNNLVEHNVEGIGLDWLTNSSQVVDNVVRFNKNYGIFIKTDGFDNLVENNTVIGNGGGIGLFEGSNNNSIISNIIADNYNKEHKEPIYMDDDSQSNLVKENISPPTTTATNPTPTPSPQSFSTTTATNPTPLDNEPNDNSKRRIINRPE